MSEETKEAPGQELMDQKALEARQREIEEQIRKQLQTVNERTAAPSQNKISVKGKKFTLPGGEPKDGPLLAVILDECWVLAHYPGVFNQNKPQDPNCFAVGRMKPESGDLVPHETSPEPQGEDCASCPKNQWKSDPKGGNGKACKNQKRLLIVPPDAGADTQPYTLYVSPTAIKKYDSYVRELAGVHKVDPVQVITEINFDPNAAYPSLTFKLSERHTNLMVMWDLRERHKAVTEHVFELRGDRE